MQVFSERACWRPGLIAIQSEDCIDRVKLAQQLLNVVGGGGGPGSTGQQGMLGGHAGGAGLGGLTAT